ncbi:MAG: tRNA 4-thiouridine(8) synthase ThiI [Methanocellales archaeon]|nr:tRNA 4-thiouridine(8) synthase ThiI [Methanocellales archaeon]MDD5485873.1 tRNA 4-thiouridine(8) synthase ThiI [Methanocellales archaeon]
MKLNCDAILVRYGEIGLKSDRTRGRHERILVDNIKSVLEFNGKEYSLIKRDWGRIFIHASDESIADLVANVFGVVSTSPVITTESDLQAMARVAAELGEETIRVNESFAIRPHKAGLHDFSTRDIGVACGDAVYDRVHTLNPRIDLGAPNREIFVEARKDKAYVYTKVLKGVGGLPIGTQGKMVALISGGIDSPVAAWLMMRRGCEIIPLYYDNEPFSDEVMRKNVSKCIDILQRWAPNFPMRVYEIPHGSNLFAIRENCDKKLTCILCKRMMYKIAVEIAKKEGAHGIITGSSLGQVASQTSANMLAELWGIDFPIYHPLIGADKSEITDLARRIGTLEASTSAKKSCTAVPKYPATLAKIDDMLREEGKLDIEMLISESLDKAKWR